MPENTFKDTRNSRIAHVLEHVDSTMDDLVTDLQTLIRQPSVSARNEGIQDCAKLVCKIMNDAGIKSELLYLDKTESDKDLESEIAPLIFGHVQSKSHPDKTLLFYNHYDVQPAEPFDLWDDPPFAGIRHKNKIFGRGSSDDKGELITRIKAVEAFLQKTGDVPCNIKFIVEGEEETGSDHIAEYLKKYQEKFACDGVIWEFGYVDEHDRAVISLGMKGLLFVELYVKESSQDAHSSLAVLIKNPVWRLIEVLKTLYDYNTGQILINGWYDDVYAFSKKDLNLIADDPFDQDALKNEFGVDSFVGGLDGFEAKKALVGGPTCNIAGINSGYIGDGAKTVLPSSATVKIDFRLIPGMNPKRQAERLIKHIESKGFGEIKVKVLHSVEAARTDQSDPFVNDVKDAADSFFTGSVVNVSSAGTGPMDSFVKILDAPCISIGSTYVFSKIHSPNEFTRIDLLNKCTRCICSIMQNFASRL